LGIVAHLLLTLQLTAVFVALLRKASLNEMQVK
jgi:hypothetical protein